MAALQIQGLTNLLQKANELKALAEEVRQNYDAKQEWVDARSEKWQESETADEWNDFLPKVEALLDEIDNIETGELE